MDFFVDTKQVKWLDDRYGQRRQMAFKIIIIKVSKVNLCLRLFFPLLVLSLPGIALGAAPVSNPEITLNFQPSPVNNFTRADRISGHTHSVTVAGKFAYIGEGSQLNVVNISNPAVPVVIGKAQPLSGLIEDILTAGKYAYVAANKAGMWIIDISNPANPRRVGTIDTPGQAYGIDVSGSYAYVAAGSAGLHVVDISEPLQPVLVATVGTEERDVDVTVVGSYAYVAAEEAGFRIIDIADSQAPVVVASLTLPGDANGVAVLPPFAYVASGGAGLHIIDISQPDAPLIVSQFHELYARSVFVVGSHAYVATERDGLQVVDVSDPVNPAVLAGFSTVGSATDVAVSNGSAFVADKLGALVVTPLPSDEEALRDLARTKSPVYMPLNANALTSPAVGSVTQ